MIIDVHTHFVPEQLPSMKNRSGSDRWPVLQCVCGHEDHKHVMISGKNFRTITDQCWSPHRRIAEMDFEGIDMQVLSPMPELLSYWFEPKDTLEFSRSINGQLSEFIQNNPKGFIGLGMVPLQDPLLAAKELRGLKHEFGLKGIEIGTHINGKSIGDPMFHSFFAEAEAQQMIIFVHALHPFGSDRHVGSPIMSNLIGFPTENAFALGSLVTGGILERFPNLKIYSSHGGGSFSSILPRLEYGWTTMEDIQKIIPKPPSYYAKKIYYDTLVYDVDTVDYLIRKFGSQQLMIGSDYPFSIREKNPGHWLEQMELTEDQKKQIQSQNAIGFFNIQYIRGAKNPISH
ncbi:amidohydrolase family protein [Niallia sp. Krafla_26]|uniref:amidohydrolase family protein n=1 Tax=Niallia sp. Krafla_26 TaxID=3064703 RepID=UPI003D17EE34